jgi:hypothetical protein
MPVWWKIQRKHPDGSWQEFPNMGLYGVGVRRTYGEFLDALDVVKQCKSIQPETALRIVETNVYGDTEGTLIFLGGFEGDTDE